MSSLHGFMGPTGSLGYMAPILGLHPLSFGEITQRFPSRTFPSLTQIGNPLEFGALLR
jgi:hypothetical protein